MPDPKPPAPAPAPPLGPQKGPLSGGPPVLPFWHESYFWYGVFVLGVFFFGMIMGWNIPALDLGSGGGGGHSSGGGGWSFGGK